MYQYTTVTIIKAVKYGGNRRNESWRNHTKRYRRFQKYPKHMLFAKKENAAETYANLKKQYFSLKALLNSLGVNMIDIDEIKG